MFRKSGKGRAGRLDFATIFIKPSILYKIKTNIGNIDYKSFINIINKTFNEKVQSRLLNYTSDSVFSFVNVFLDTLYDPKILPPKFLESENGFVDMQKQEV